MSKYSSNDQAKHIHLHLQVFSLNTLLAFIFLSNYVKTIFNNLHTQSNYTIYFYKWLQYFDKSLVHFLFQQIHLNFYFQVTRQILTYTKHILFKYLHFNLKKYEIIYDIMHDIIIVDFHERSHQVSFCIKSWLWKI